MNEDQLYLLILYIIWAVLFSMLIYRSDHKLKTLVIHLLSCIGYSIYLFYNLKYHSEGGTSLVWLVLWMFILGLHSVGILVLIIYSIFNKNIFNLYKKILNLKK